MAKISSTWRPMPPALLISSTARSAQALCVGPNSAAGPAMAKKNPILNASAGAFAERPAGADQGSAGSAGKDAMTGGDEWNSVILYLLVGILGTGTSAARFHRQARSRVAGHRTSDRVQLDAQGQAGRGEAAGRLMPGRPAMLPDRVADVGEKRRDTLGRSALPSRRRRSARWHRRGRKDHRARSAPSEALRAGGLQRRPKDAERIPIGRLGNRGLAGRLFKMPARRGWRTGRRARRIADASRVGEVGVQSATVRTARSESWPLRRAAEVGHVGLDQNRASTESRQHLSHTRAARVERSRVRARHAQPQPFRLVGCGERRR